MAILTFHGLIQLALKFSGSGIFHMAPFEFYDPTASLVLLVYLMHHPTQHTKFHFYYIGNIKVVINEAIDIIYP